MIYHCLWLRAKILSIHKSSAREVDNAAYLHAQILFQIITIEGSISFFNPALTVVACLESEMGLIHSHWTQIVKNSSQVFFYQLFLYIICLTL